MRPWKKYKRKKLKQLLLEKKITMMMIFRVRRIPTGVETLVTSRTRVKVTKMGRRKTEIGKPGLGQERIKITGEDRMGTTKETRTEINLIGKIPFL